MPPELIATVVLAASSVLFGLGLPLTGGLAIIGIVRGLIDTSWRTFVVGLLLTVADIAAGVALRTWGATLATDDALARANHTAAIVFTSVTPPGVILGLVLVVVALAARYLGAARARARRRDS